MTEPTNTLLLQHQVRKSKKQKRAFFDFVSSTARENGYTARLEKGYLGAQNIIVGDPDNAKVVYTAHYDTCARLPFPNFITPKNFFVYLLYQFLIVAVFFAVPVVAIELGIAWAIEAFEITDGILPVLLPLASAIYAIAFVYLIAAGPANKHTANDNTSGVAVLLELMQAMPEEQRATAAFVFFDLEEAGLFGSMGFAAKHKKAMARKPLINFDCVSDGDTVLFALRRGARDLAPAITEAFPKTEVHTPDICTKGVFYPSDQANFQKGIGVAALHRTKLGGMLYMNRIHTKRDTVFCEENIAYLTEGALRLTAQFHKTGEDL